MDVTLQPGDVSEVVEVAGDSRKPIDIRSSTISHNVTGEELDLLPKARSFVAIAATSPSVNLGQIEGGIQVNGASSAENTYMIDGVVTTSLLNGVSRQDTIFEYLQEVQVKTGGINAEYGGALGGVVSAVTRSGGNRLQGELHYYVTGSPLSAGPVRRLVLSPSDETTVSFVQDDRQHDVAHEPGGSIGGPIVKNRLFFFGSYSPRLIDRTSHYGFLNGADPGSMEQSQTATQAFGKLTVSGVPHPGERECALHADALDGDARALRRYDAQRRVVVAGRSCRKYRPRLAAGSDEHRRRCRLVARTLGFPERARRILPRQVCRHGHPHDDLGQVEPVVCRRAGVLSEPPASLRDAEHSPIAHHHIRHDRARVGPGRLQPGVPRGRHTPAQGRSRLSTHD